MGITAITARRTTRARNEKRGRLGVVKKNQIVTIEGVGEWEARSAFHFFTPFCCL